MAFRIFLETRSFQADKKQKDTRTSTDAYDLREFSASYVRCHVKFVSTSTCTVPTSRLRTVEYCPHIVYSRSHKDPILKECQESMAKVKSNISVRSQRTLATTQNHFSSRFKKA